MVYTPWSDFNVAQFKIVQIGYFKSSDFIIGRYSTFPGVVAPSSMVAQMYGQIPKNMETVFKGPDKPPSTIRIDIKFSDKKTDEKSRVFDKSKLTTYVKGVDDSVVLRGRVMISEKIGEAFDIPEGSDAVISPSIPDSVSYSGMNEFNPISLRLWR